MKCPNCKAEIPEDEPLTIKGVAGVEGFTSIKEFHKDGIEWIPHDSWDEAVKCPNCGEFAPLR